MPSLKRQLTTGLAGYLLKKLGRKQMFKLMEAYEGKCLATTLEKNNRCGFSQAPLPVLRYPLPYRCAVSINNDTDGLFYPVMRSIHDFVNGRGETPFGQGLGLEMADSFWAWSKEGCVSLFHGHPSEQDIAPSPETDELAILAKAGYLDTLHGFGEWPDEYRLTRDKISWALEYMAGLGIRPGVYTAHGGYNMRHNVGGPWGYYQEGDLPESPSYCLDLLADFGFRFYWSDVFYDLDKYGDFHYFKSKDAMHAAYFESVPGFSKYLTTRCADDFESVKNVWENFSASEQSRLRAELFNVNPVLIPARDGRNIWAFKRFRGHDGPNNANFIEQLNAERLNQLEAKQAAVIIYQHFGVWRANGMGKGHVSQRYLRAPKEALDLHTVWAFKELADRYHSGRVWVATTQRLLHYLWMRDHLHFSVETLSDKVLVHIGPIISPDSADPVKPSMEDVRGFGVLIPANWPETQFLLEGCPITAVRELASDFSGQDTLSIPWQPLAYPFS